MNSWIFYITDSLGSMTAVVGSGGNQTEAEDGARVKWAALYDSREDFGHRAPIVEVIYSTISTEADSNEMVGLIL